MSTLSAQFAAASSSATTITQLNDLSGLAWRAWGSGTLTDTDAEAFSNALESRKQSLRAKAALPSERLRTTPRRRPARDHRRSITRRRTMAAASLMPNRLACLFTLGGMATLAVVAREIKEQRHNLCEFHLGKIAGLAGVCMTTARDALHEAQRLKLISITERRRNHRPSLTNRVVITSKLWLAWLRLAPQGGRVQISGGHVRKKDYPSSRTPETTPRATAKPRNRRRRSNFYGRQPINEIEI